MNPRTIRWISNTLALALALALGLQLAWWAWRFIVPPWRGAAPANAVAAASPLALGRQLFGDRDAPTVASAASPANAGGVRLKGVFAVDGRTLSAAVVNLGGRDQTVRLNQELSPGLKLVEVAPEYIVLNRAGARERVELDRFDARARTGSAGTAGIGTTAAAGPAPTSFRLNVANTGANSFSLSRQELNTVLQDSRQMNFLGRIGPAPSGGVRVEDAPPGSLSAKLGLQAGDVITNINGQPINSPGDLARLYAQFATIGNVNAEVRRGGAPVTLSYAIQN